MFPDGLVLGVFNTVTQKTCLNPPAAQRLQKGDVLVMMRPTDIPSDSYQPTEKPVPIDLGKILALERFHDLKVHHNY